jgi:hypothetical protein
MEQVRMPSVPTVAAQPLAMAPQPIQQAYSYIPAQPQTASYIPAVQAAAPQVVETISAQPQVASYIPAAQPQVIETISAQPQYSQVLPQVASYIPAAQTVVSAQPAVTYTQPTSVVETLSPGVATTVAQPVSYIPAPQVVEAGVGGVVSYVAPTAQAQVVESAMPSGQSVIVEQVGDWLVCEDALGVFYHHTPTQQSFDNCPAEFLALFPQGYAPPPLGGFAAAGYGTAAAVQPGFVAAAPAVVQSTMPQVASYIPAQQPITYGTQVAYAGSPMVETVMPGGAQVVNYQYVQ